MQAAYGAHIRAVLPAKKRSPLQSSRMCRSTARNKCTAASLNGRPWFALTSVLVATLPVCADAQQQEDAADNLQAAAPRVLMGVVACGTQRF